MLFSLYHVFDVSLEMSIRPSRPDVIQLAGGGALVFWKPVALSDPVTYYIQHSINGKRLI